MSLRPGPQWLTPADLGVVAREDTAEALSGEGEGDGFVPPCAIPVSVAGADFYFHISSRCPFGMTVLCWALGVLDAGPERTQGLELWSQRVEWWRVGGEGPLFRLPERTTGEKFRKISSLYVAGCCDKACCAATACSSCR